MPGFFEGLKRIAQGKPVFDANDQNTGWTGKDGQEKVMNQGNSPEQKPAGRSSSSLAGVVKGNASTFPKVYVKRTRTHLSGSNQDVYCHIVNDSKGAVELEEIDLAGRSQNLGGSLRPGEEREYRAYSGPRLKSESYREAHLNYKDETGDYFQSIYDVEYQYESDKTYSVEGLHLRLPIRDIYG